MVATMEMPFPLGCLNLLLSALDLRLHIKEVAAHIALSSAWYLLAAAL